METIIDDGTWKTEAEIPEKERYGRYLASREWGLLRVQVKQRSGGICERCKANTSDAVHHLTYERKYKEQIEDLQDICEDCHRFTHGKSNFDPCLTRVAQLRGVFRTPMTYILSFVLQRKTAIDGEYPVEGEGIFICSSEYSPRSQFMFGLDDRQKGLVDLKAYIGCLFRVLLEAEIQGGEPTLIRDIVFMSLARQYPTCAFAGSWLSIPALTPELSLPLTPLVDERSPH